MSFGDVTHLWIDTCCFLVPVGQRASGFMMFQGTKRNICTQSWVLYISAKKNAIWRLWALNECKINYFIIETAIDKDEDDT